MFTDVAIRTRSSENYEIHNLMRSADRPGIKFKVACDVINNRNFFRMDFVTSQGFFPRFPGDWLIVSGSGFRLSFSVGYFDKNWSSTESAQASCLPPAEQGGREGKHRAPALPRSI